VKALTDSDEYWGVGVEPSAEQQADWAGRDPQRTALIGSGPGRLADIGCGFGHFVAWARAHEWDAYGFERDEWACERAALPGTVVASLDDLPGPFDVVTAWEVLEHVEEPIAFATRLRGLLVPGGRFVLSCPNFAAMKLRWEWMRANGRAFEHRVRPDEHISQFSEDGLRRVLQAAGYSAIRFPRPPLAHYDNALFNALVRHAPALRVGMFAEAVNP
jgi:SAM-dependent methyltransferase